MGQPINVRRSDLDCQIKQSPEVFLTILQRTGISEMMENLFPMRSLVALLVCTIKLVQLLRLVQVVIAKRRLQLTA